MSAILQKCQITQQQALDLLSEIEALEELLITAISLDADADFPWDPNQREALATHCATVSAQSAYIAKNLRKP